MEVEDYLLMRKGHYAKVEREAMMYRHQTALIVEGFVGKGNGVRFVNDAWPIGEKQEVKPEQIRELLKKKREADALRKLNGRPKDTDRV